MPHQRRHQGTRLAVTSRALAVAIALSALMGAPARAGTLFDPQIPWRTLETPHFRVNYDARQEAIAQRAGVFAEEAYAKVTPFLKSKPPQKVDLTLIDNEDTVNGFAFPYPSSMMYIYLTTPNQDMLSGRYESWLKQIITHEFTHVAQFEANGGLTDLINRVFGRALYPNLFQPVFLIEGLAVTTESRFTQGGRAKEGDFDMILRSAAAADQLLSIDQATGWSSLTEWPGGSSTYIYGSYFYQYLIEHYGADVPGRISHEYGAFPWLGINQAIGRVLPGKTAYALWDELKAYLKERATRQIAAIREHPVTASDRLTTSGFEHHHPMWTADGKLLYAEYTPNQSPSLMLDSLDGKPARRLFGKLYTGSYTLSQGRFLYLSAGGEVGNYNVYDDVYRYDLKTKKVHQLTEAKRASDPAVSPDGKHFIATLNGGGTTNLALFDTGGALQAQLTHHEDGTQYSGTVWSPQGDLVATSAWRNGSRDLYVFRPGETQPEPLWRDSAIDIDPQWSPDGKCLYFASDRSGGVFNVFAYRLADKKLFQVTNVLGAAVEPAISPDGKRLAFASYSSDGWDIHAMPLDPATWREVPITAATVYEPVSGAPMAAPAVPEHEELPAIGNPFPSHGYNAWPSFAPKNWAPVSYIDESSYMVGVNSIAQDVLMQHYAFINAGWGFGGNRPYYSLYYQNDQLPPSLTVSLSDLPTSYAVSRRQPGQQRENYDLWQRQIGGSVSATFPSLPSKLLGTYWITGPSLTVGYSWLTIGDLGIRNSGSVEALRPTPDDVNALKGKPQPGQINSMVLRYQYADNYRSKFAVSPEYGSAFGLEYEKAGSWFGGTTSFDRISGDFRRYIGLPWKHHVLAVRTAAGANLGKSDGDFYLGGTTSTNLLTTVDRRYVGGVASEPLRGYSRGLLSGNRMALGSLEYRFPIAEIQHGPGTLPFWVSRVSGAVFTEAGLVGTDRMGTDPHVGVGAEARTVLEVMNVPTELRLGLARGTHPTDGVTQGYLELGISF
ncbi:MAG TPA: BamA/TamA family outer membrane protein [Stenomitos sp.]